MLIYKDINFSNNEQLTNFKDFSQNIRSFMFQKNKIFYNANFHNIEKIIFNYILKAIPTYLIKEDLNER